MDPLGAGTALGWLAFLVLSTLVGAAYSTAYRFQPDRFVATLAGGLLFGVLWWVVLWLTIAPLAAGLDPSWSVGQAAAAFPQLVASIFFGGLMAAVFHVACRATIGDAATIQPIATASAAIGQRVVIVGGGFGGTAAAQRFEQLLAHRPDISVTLISQSNFLLFTPMLSEVAAGTLIPRHVAVPLRAACPRTGFRAAVVTSVDTAARTVTIQPVAGGPVENVMYDELILAAGAVPAFHELPGLDEHALTLKSLPDAAAIHDRVIGALERAEAEVATSARRRLLTFVVAGGGFAGVETMAELRDMVQSSLIHYPNIEPAELSFVLVHSREQLLPELNDQLGAYARERLERKGIEFRMGQRIAAADALGVTLVDGSVIPTGTFIWTAGNQPAALASVLASEHLAGVLATDDTLRVEGVDYLWAVGDCARIPDPARQGQPCPPTAQHAMRQGHLVADNVLASLDSHGPKPFTFRTLGMLVVLGHNTAAAEIRGRRFSGLLAWLMWRSIYLARLPGFERKVRVLLDWMLDLGFPRDIVVIPAAGRTDRPHGESDGMPSSSPGNPL